MKPGKNKNADIKGALRPKRRPMAMTLAVLAVLTGVLTGCGKESGVVGSNSGVMSAAGAGSSVKSSAGTIKTAVTGSTPGNSLNDGIAVQSGDWIYFVSYNINSASYTGQDSTYSIEKIKKDGTGKTTLLSESLQWSYGDINVVGNWIYFTSVSSPDHQEADRVVTINRMHTDGSARTKLYSTKAENGEGIIAYVNVVGDWIYFIELSYKDANPGESSINRVHTDGSSPSKLITEENTATAGGFIDATIDNGWLYYEKCGASGGDGEGLDTINKMRIDGTDNTQLLAGSSSDESISFATAVGGWIYYCIRNTTLSQSDLYKMHTDGSGSTKIVGKTSSETPYFDAVNAGNDWIYYHSVVGNTNYLSKIRADGTGNTHVTTIGDGLTGCFGLSVAGDWIYYDVSSTANKTSTTYRVKTDGTGAQAAS